MTKHQIGDTDKFLWQRYVKAYNDFVEVSQELYANAFNKVELVRIGLNSSDGRSAAFNVLNNLGVEELQQLFDELLAFAAYSHGFTHIAHTLILSLPHGWLLSNIESYAEPILETGDFETYRAILTLYSKIDTGLTQKLAYRAIKHENIDIQEAGEDFLKKLS
ncbi:MAG: hypothetical protein H6672_06175 [Anaerolineaceae bacterium]|nr:hypothetical protein [Anaerolineaceae bacterium]